MSRSGWRQCVADASSEGEGYVEVCRDQWVYANATDDPSYVYAWTSWGCGLLRDDYLDAETRTPPISVVRWSKNLTFDAHCWREYDRWKGWDLLDLEEYMEEIVAEAPQQPSWDDTQTEPRFVYINSSGDAVVTNLWGTHAITWIPAKHFMSAVRQRSPPPFLFERMHGDPRYTCNMNYDGGESDGRGNVRFGFLEIRIGEEVICTHKASGDETNRYPMYVYVHGPRGSGWVPVECIDGKS